MLSSLHKECIPLCMLSVFVLSACTQAERKQRKEVVRQSFASFVEVDSVRYDFGELKADEGRIRHRFILRNTSHLPLFISDIISGCGCMTVGYTKNVFASGDTASVTVTFFPGSMKGAFDKSTLILLNDGRFYLSVSMRGIIP